MKRSILFLLLFALTQLVNAQSVTIYVSPAGNDQNSGKSADAPLSTLQKALDNWAAIKKSGKTVSEAIISLAGGGTYHLSEPVKITPKNGGSENATLIIRSADNQKAFIDKLLPAPIGGGFAMKNYWVWGSSVVKGEDGKYHMFASRWSKEVSFGNWVTNSEVVHAISNTPVDPYTFHDVVLPVRGKEYWDGLCTHNPRIVKYGDQYLLYYFGNTYDFPQPNAANPDPGEENWRKAWMNKRLGVAISNSVYGPWKRLDNPVIEPRPGHWDASITSNPAPVVNEKTGEILLMYKSSTKGLVPPLLLGVSKATKPEGPYIRLSEEPIFRFETNDNNRIDVEDPYIWWNGDKYEAILKDRSGEICGEEGGGVHVWSNDGIEWNLFENVKAYSKTIRWDDGSTSYQNHFERPFLLIENGVPTHLFAATGTGPKAWQFDRTWNMVIPLKP